MFKLEIHSQIITWIWRLLKYVQNNSFIFKGETVVIVEHEKFNLEVSKHDSRNCISSKNENIELENIGI